MHASDRFIYLVERLHRANLRSTRCISDEEYGRARRWLVLWNRALQLEYGRRNGQPAQAHRSDARAGPGDAPPA